MVRLILSIAGLVLALVGFALFLALGFGVWVAKQKADQETTALAEKAQAAGDVAAHVIALIREIIARAELGLAAARVEQGTAPPTEQPDPFVRMAMWKAKRSLPEEVEKARDAVGVASEVVIVAGAALDVFGERELDRGPLGVRPEEMHAARAQLDAAAADLRNARHILGVPIPTSDEGTTPDQLANVDAALDRAKGITNEFDRALSTARKQVDAAKQKAEMWSLRVAIGISLLAALAAAGQVFMARACWRGLRGRHTTHPLPTLQPLR